LKTGIETAGRDQEQEEQEISARRPTPEGETLLSLLQRLLMAMFRPTGETPIRQGVRPCFLIFLSPLQLACPV
jgi:hypothetical protein